MTTKKKVQSAPILQMIENFKASEVRMALEMQAEFVALFKAADPASNDGLFRFTEFTNASDIGLLSRAPGFYLILADLDIGPNRCTLTVDGLNAIYRGHSTNVFERVMSHLDNERYKKMKKDRKQDPWNRCMKIVDASGDPGGINIDDAKYSTVRWATLVLSLPGSSEFMRKQAEWAFDDVFERPKASESEKSRPPVLSQENHYMFAACEVCGAPVSTRKTV